MIKSNELQRNAKNRGAEAKQAGCTEASPTTAAPIPRGEVGGELDSGHASKALVGHQLRCTEHALDAVWHGCEDRGPGAQRGEVGRISHAQAWNWAQA